jgi:hypothetical protein
MTSEDRAFVKLRCTIAYNDEKTKRFYWRDPVGDHTTNKILMIEKFTMNRIWEVVYEAETLV